MFITEFEYCGVDVCQNGGVGSKRKEKETGGRKAEEGGDRGGGQSGGVYQVFVLRLHSFHKKNMRAFLLSLCSETSNIEIPCSLKSLYPVKCLILVYFGMEGRAVPLCLLYAYLSIS